uniref:GrpE protein homolog n=1 Tax=Felis catus TaxID=9685 RepID=A0ABI7XLY4_FELCA
VLQREPTLRAPRAGDRKCRVPSGTPDGHEHGAQRQPEVWRSRPGPWAGRAREGCREEWHLAHLVIWSKCACAASVSRVREYGRAVSVGGPAAGAAPPGLECRVRRQVSEAGREWRVEGSARRASWKDGCGLEGRELIHQASRLLRSGAHGPILQRRKLRHTVAPSCQAKEGGKSGGHVPQRGRLHPFSTATQRTAGEDCSSEDPPDDLGPSLAERALKLKAVKLEKEVQDLTMRYQRAVADGENIRRRTQRCVEDAKIFGIQSFCKDLVEVADILEKTTEYISEETEPGDQKLTLEKIFRGLSLLEAKLKSVFAKHGLEKMTPIGDKYDPHEHELICHVPAGVGVQPGTVALVRQDGYKLHGRTIRLAQVEVAVESQRRL